MSLIDLELPKDVNRAGIQSSPHDVTRVMLVGGKLFVVDRDFVKAVAPTSPHVPYMEWLNMWDMNI